MKKIRLDLKGDAEKLFNEFKEMGMSDSTIIGKSLKCLAMVNKGELISQVEDTLTNYAKSINLDALTTLELKAYEILLWEQGYSKSQSDSLKKNLESISLILKESSSQREEVEKKITKENHP